MCIRDRRRYLPQRVQPASLEHLHKTDEYLCRAARIIHGPVMIVQGDAQLPRNCIQLVAVQARKKYMRETHRVEYSLSLIHIYPDPVKLSVKVGGGLCEVVRKVGAAEELKV